MRVFVLVLILAAAVSTRDWNEVVRDERVTWDLEKTPLVIKTEITNFQSRNVIFLNFNVAKWIGIKVHYGTAYHKVSSCHDYKNFAIQPSQDEDGLQIWKIAKTEDSFVFYFNGERLDEVKFSESSACGDSWRGDVVDLISFNPDHDTASKYFGAPAPPIPSEDWNEVVRDERVTWDLEETPLVIKTEITNFQSRNVIFLNFNVAKWIGIKVHYGTAYHKVSSCHDYKKFAIQPSQEADAPQIWKIAKMEDGFVFFFNEQVLDVVSFTESSACENSWRGDVVDLISFNPDHDTASKYFGAPAPPIPSGEDWEEITLNLDFDWDLEKTPIEVKTDITNFDAKNVVFLNANDEMWIVIKWQGLTVQNKVSDCHDYVDFPVQPPRESPQIWKITKVADSFEFYCNDLFLGRVLFSENSWCESAWSGDVVNWLSFHPTFDRSSKGYRAPPQETCDTVF